LSSPSLTTAGYRRRIALEAFDSRPALAQLKKRHPRGTQEWQQIAAFLGSCETMGTFVKHGPPRHLSYQA